MVAAWSLVWLGGVLTGVVAGHDTTRVVAGRVRDARGQRLSGVEVLVAQRVVDTTRGDGWFTAVMPSAVTSLGFRRIGYRPVWFSVDAKGPAADTVSVELTAVPQVLPDLEVAAPRWSKPLRYAGTTNYDDFFRRQKLGLGSFLTREQIDRTPALHTLELLQGLPGVRVTPPMTNPLGAPDGAISFVRCNGPGAKLTIWIDGQLQHLSPDEKGPAGWAIALERIGPAQIEMIEVFRGAAQLPGEYHDDGCAAIGIWTRWNAPKETRDPPP